MCVEMKAVQSTWVAEAFCGKKSNNPAFGELDGHMITESKQMCVEFQLYFTELCEVCGTSGMMVNFTSYLRDIQCLSIGTCTSKKFPGQDGLTPELYFYMPDLFSDLLADIYHNRQLNRINRSSLSHGVMVLLLKDLNENKTDNLRPITLLNVDYKILAIVLAKRLALSIKRLETHR